MIFFFFFTSTTVKITVKLTSSHKLYCTVNTHTITWYN